MLGNERLANQIKYCELSKKTNTEKLKNIGKKLYQI